MSPAEMGVTLGGMAIIALLAWYFLDQIPEDRPLPMEEAGYLELVLKDVAGVKERVLHWD